MTTLEKIVKWTGITVISLIGVSAISLWILFGKMMCGETLLDKIPSPNKSKTIYVFQSGCGATSPNSRHYFLEFKGLTDFEVRKDLKKRHEFFRHTRGGSSVKWSSETDIEIIYSPDPTRDNFIHKQKSNIKNIRIVVTDKSKKSLPR